RTPRARCSSAGSGGRSALHSPAWVSQVRAAAGSSSRSEPWSPSQVLTNDCTSSSGIGAGLASSPGTHEGRGTRDSLSPRDHLNELTGLLVTLKIVLVVTNEELVPTLGRPGRSEVHVMVILLGLAAAVLYGSGDFLGGLAARRVHVLAVLTLAEGAGAAVALAAAAMSPGPPSLAGLAWGAGAGLIGGLRLILFSTRPAAGAPSALPPRS